MSPQSLHTQQNYFTWTDRCVTFTRGRKTIFIPRTKISLQYNERTSFEMYKTQWPLKRYWYSRIKLLVELRLRFHDVHNCLRMNEETHLKLLFLIIQLSEKMPAVRWNVSSDGRLTVTVQFLVTGRTYECLNFSIILSPQAQGRIVFETCIWIYEIFKGRFNIFFKPWRFARLAVLFFFTLANSI